MLPLGRQNLRLWMRIIPVCCNSVINLELNIEPVTFAHDPRNSFSDFFCLLFFSLNDQFVMNLHDKVSILSLLKKEVVGIDHGLFYNIGCGSLNRSIDSESLSSRTFA